MSAIPWLLGELAEGQSTLTASSAGVDGDALTITLSAPADAASAAAASDFTVSAGDTELSVDSAAVNGNTITLTLAESVADADCDSTAITVSYQRSDSSITASGSELQDFTDLAVSNATDNAPAVESIETDVTGQYIYVTFCEAIKDISFQWSDFSAFTVSVNNNAQAVDDLVTPAATAGRLELQLGSKAIKEGDAVTIAFDQSKANDSYPLQDLNQGGKLVESWVADDYDVTNNVDSPPALVSVAALWDVITLTYSEALDEHSVPDKSAFSISDQPYSVTINSVGVSGKTVTLSLSEVIRGDLDPKFRLSYAAPSESPLQQADGQEQAEDFHNRDVDSSTPTTKPVVQSAAVNGATLKITFDIPLKNVAAASAFRVAGQDGVTVSAASFSGAVVTLTLSPPVGAGSTIAVSYAKPASPPRVEGRNTVDADSFSDRAVTNNTPSLAPTFVSAAIDATGGTLSITMSADLLASTAGAPTAYAFALSGGTAAVGGVSISGKTVSLALSPKADVGETITVAYTQPSGAMDGKLQSLSGGHLVGSWTAQSVTNNADGVPRPTGASVNAATLSISFDRQLDALSVPAASTFTLGGTTSTVISVSIGGSIVTLTLSAAVAHDAVVAVSHVKPQTGGVKRLGQELFAESFASMAVTNNTPDPRPTLVSASINAAGDTLSIVMSGDLLEDMAGLPAASAFTLSRGTAAVSGVSINGVSISLTLSPKADAGETITVAYTQPTGDMAGKLQSLSGGHLIDSWTPEAVNNSADGVPRPTGATVNGATLTLGFDRPLDAMSVPVASTFTLGGTPATVSSVSISGSSVTLTLSAEVAHDDEITVGYAKPASGGIKRSGQALYAASFTSLAATNRTPEPLVRSVVGDEAEIVITFSTALDTTSTPDASAFSLGADGPAIVSLTLGATTVSLSLAAALSEGGEYTLSYRVPSESPLHTADGSPVPTSTHTVANVTDVAPAVESVVGDGTTLTVTFDQPLNAMAAVAVTSFSLSGGSERTVTDISIDGSTLSLTLSSALTEGEEASLTYTKPADGGIADPTGNRADGFSQEIDNQTDTAPGPASGDITGDEIVIVLDQDIYEDPRFDPLAEDSVVYDHFTLSGTDAEITAIVISNDGPGGVGKIVITLSEDVDELDTVLVTYLPDSGTIRIREDEDGERRAQIDSYQLTNLTGTPPTVASATLDGAALRLVFDRAMDEDAGAEAGWFAFENDALQVDSATLSGVTLSLVVSPQATEDAEYMLTYTPPEMGGLASASGVPAATFTEGVTNVTDTAPRPVSANADATGSVAGANQITLRFDQRLEPPGAVDTSWFELTPALEIKRVAIDATRAAGDQLLIELEAGDWVREGASVALRYTQPDTGGLRDDDGDPDIEDDGNLVATFTIAIQNNVDVAPQLESATVNGRAVTLEFDQELDDDATPPPSCEVLQLEDADVDCSALDLYTWFTVERTDGTTLAIDTVEVSGATVVLQLSDRVGKGDAVNVGYQPKSYDNDGRNLRDVSTPAHTVNGFIVPGPDYPGMAVENVTPARATSARLIREPTLALQVAFDHELGSTADVDLASFSVTADGSEIGVQRVSATETELSIRLTSPVPQCAVVRIAYEPGEPPLTDSDGRPIEAFAFGVENLLVADLGLACAAWDGAAIVLTFGAETQLPDQAETAWSLRVGYKPREFSVATPASGTVRLTPSAPVCLGDDVEFLWARPEPAGTWSWTRSITRAAPCAESAVAEGTQLRVRFDQALDPTLPSASVFTMSGGADVAEAVSIDGSTLLLRLTAPGIGAGREVDLTYSGSVLTGGGLTVGPFTIPVRDDTEPPRFVSGFGVGELIALRFDQPLLPRAVAASRFILAGLDDEPKVSRVEISGASLYLHLASSLPDEPDLFGIVYLARSSGGLAGLTGVRVSDGVFVVDNYTETPPRVAAVEADRRTLDVRFNQRVDGREALAADFVVHAGRRRLDVTEMEWSKQGVVLTLSGRVTSPDAVRLSYAPSGEGRVRDLSGNELAEFEFWADNVTRAAGSMTQIVEEARLRSSSGGTTFARELVRGVVGGDGLRVTNSPGTGEARVAYGGALLAVDAADSGEEPLTVGWARLDDASDVLAQLEHVPSWCWDDDESDRTTAWWLGESDAHGVPSDRGIPVAVTISGAVGARGRGVGCVLDLVSGEWRFRQSGDAARAPALILSRESGPGLSPLPLAR